MCRNISRTIYLLKKIQRHYRPGLASKCVFCPISRATDVRGHASRCRFVLGSRQDLDIQWHIALTVNCFLFVTLQSLAVFSYYIHAVCRLCFAKNLKTATRREEFHDYKTRNGNRIDITCFLWPSKSSRPQFLVICVYLQCLKMT